MKRRITLVAVIFLSVVGILSGWMLASSNHADTPSRNIPVFAPPPSKQEESPYPYKIPTIPKKRSYLTLLAGDSILASLGVNANALRLKLISYYPNNEFVNYNYGFPATNIESLPDRLHKETLNQGGKFQPILTMDVDLIIIDSFGYNPLSNLPLDQGLAKQEEILDESIREIISKLPGTGVAIFAPLSPNKKKFAQGVYDLSPSERQRWAEERIAYIKNAINFANKNNIPLINVYEKSLTPTGDGDLKYIDTHDYIHPSKEGVKLMADTIAEFIFKNKIFPDN
jgi:lysophospholipase L1-like esterase